jgi:hypothetical protein
MRGKFISFSVYGRKFYKSEICHCHYAVSVPRLRTLQLPSIFALLITGTIRLDNHVPTVFIAYFLQNYFI